MYYTNCKLANLTWFKVGGCAKLLFIPESSNDLVTFLQNFSNNRIDNIIDPNIINTKQITILGAGSNVLISDKGVDGITIKIGRGLSYIKLENKNDEYFLIVGSGTLNYSLSQYCMINGIVDFEFLSSIPGSIGGGVYMNAGSYGNEYKDILVKVKCVDHEGNYKEFNVNDLEMGYRYSALQGKEYIVLEACFKCKKPNVALSKIIQSKINEIKNHRRSTQPIHEKTCGSTFTNPDNLSAWQVVDSLGMRGYKHNGAMISNMHTNFLINYNNATADDIWTLGEMVRDKAKSKFDLDLKWEIKKLGIW